MQARTWRGFARQEAELSSSSHPFGLLTQPESRGCGIQRQFFKPIKEKALRPREGVLSPSPESAGSEPDLWGQHLKPLIDPLRVKK